MKVSEFTTEEASVVEKVNDTGAYHVIDELKKYLVEEILIS